MNNPAYLQSRKFFAEQRYALADASVPGGII
jgi:hypothetical protein